MITLEIKVKPGSKQNSMTFDATGLLVVGLKAMAVDGQANTQLIKYLAKVLRVKQKQIEIWRGGASRIKLIRIAVDAVEQERIVLFLKPD